MLQKTIGTIVFTLAAGSAALCGEAAPPAPGPTAPAPAAPRFQTPADIREMTNLQYLMDIARVQLRYQDVERCEETLRKALPLTKEPGDKQQVLVMLGQLLQRKQDQQGAAAAFEEALSHVTDLSARAQVVFPLCDSYMQQNENAKAEKLLTDLREALAKDPKPEHAWIKNTCLQRLMMLWRKEEGKIEKVIAALEADLAKDPENISVIEQLTELYTSGKRDAKRAAALLEKLVEKNPKELHLQMRLAVFYAEAKEYEKAIAIHKKAVESEPKFNASSSHYQIATLLLQSGKKDEAVAWARKNLGNDPADAGGAGLLGMFFEQAGLHDDAIGVYETAAGKAASVHVKVDYLLRGAELARRTKNYEKAEKSIRAVLKEHAADKNIQARAKQALIRVYEDQGKIGELKFDN